MPYLCSNCAHAKTSIVKEHNEDGTPVVPTTYHLNNHKESIHRVRCKKKRWMFEGARGPIEQLKTLITIKRYHLPYCIDHQPMDPEGAEDHRKSLPETKEEYRERWKR